ncbi:hypothetical protein Tco_0864087, partial [Tanacetum coccineum]
VNEEESDEESDDESNEDSDEEVQGANIEEEEMDEEAIHEEDGANELYKDVNINLEGRDTVMTDASLPNVQGTQVTKDTHVILTAPINPEGQQQSSSVSSGFVSNMLNPRPDTNKIESNKSIHISDEQKNLYKALVEAYESNKLILDTYGDTASFKRRRDDEDKDEEPSAGSNRGSKRRRAGKEPESTSTPKEKTPKSTGKSTKGSKSLHKSAGEYAHAEEPIHAAKVLEEPAHQEFETGATEDQPVDETLQPSKWCQKPTRLLSSDRDWNKTFPADHGPVQPWLSNLAWEEGPRESFDELMDTPLDFLAFMMNEAVKTVVQLQSERLRDEAQAENEDFLNKLDDNIKKIIKDQVKEQVKAQVSKILPKIKKTVNEQLEVEVMTRSSTESKTSFAIAANLSELELKKILIDKMESNKSIHRSDEQKNLYKALVEAYKSNKLILDTYVGKEPESTSTPKVKTPKSTGKSTKGSKSLHKSAGESAHAEEPMHTAKVLEEPAHQEFETGATEDQPVDETLQPSEWFQKPTRLPSSDRD